MAIASRPVEPLESSVCTGASVGPGVGRDRVVQHSTRATSTRVRSATCPPTIRVIPRAIGPLVCPPPDLLAIESA